MFENYSNQANTFLSTPSHLITVSFHQCLSLDIIDAPSSRFGHPLFCEIPLKQLYDAEGTDKNGTWEVGIASVVPSWEACSWEVLGYLMRASLDRSKYLGLSFLSPLFGENCIVLHCAFKRLLNFTGEKSDSFIYSLKCCVVLTTLAVSFLFYKKQIQDHFPQGEGSLIPLTFAGEDACPLDAQLNNWQGQFLPIKSVCKGVVVE